MIGAKNFGEEFVLGQLYKQALEAKGFDVSYKENLGSTELVQTWLTSGKINFYPEYTGRDRAGRLPQQVLAQHRPCDVQLARSLEAEKGYTVLTRRRSTTPTSSPSRTRSHRERNTVTTPYDRPSDPAKRHSAALTDGPDRAGARSMLKATGFTDEDLAKPIVGVGTTWIETMPCNLNQRDLAVHVKRGVRDAGGTPMEFNTVAVSDGVSMGTSGMRASLVSREVIADSIELVARGHLFDGLVQLVACDKTNPGGAMAVGRLDIPSVLFYSGSIAPGLYRQREVSIGDVYEGIGAYAAGKISAADLHELESAACPGAGACGGQFTANTMSTILDFLGLSPFGANGIPAIHRDKEQAAYEAGRLAVQLVRDNVTPRSLVTRESFENAVASVAATGGSTNAVLHLVAIARDFGIEFTIDDFERISAKTPIIADMKPWGRWHANDMYRAGGGAARGARAEEGRAAARGRAGPSTAARSARSPTPPSRPRARSSSSRSRRRSSRVAASRSSTATSRPRAAP